MRPPHLFLPLVALLSVGFAYGQESCFVVNGRTVMSDPDGTGPQPFPPNSNCRYNLQCPEDEAVVIRTLEGRILSSAWFTVQLTMRMFGHTFLNHNPPYNGANLNVVNIPFYTSEVELHFQNRAPGDEASGGYSLTYECVKVCSATEAPAQTMSRNTTFAASWTTSTDPEVCIFTLSAPPCRPDEMVSYDFVRRPEYTDGGHTSPDWHLIMTPGMPYSSMPAAIFPNGFLGPEMFLTSTERRVFVRALAATSVDVQINVYCTPLSNCSTSPQVLEGLPFGAIVSDYDGRYDEIPYVGPQTCEWDIRCPYDTNVFIPLLAGGLQRSRQDAVRLIPTLGNEQAFDTEVIGYTNMQRGTPWLDVVFSVATSGGDRGFTLKWECVSQCALPSPQHVTAGPVGTLENRFTALQRYSDMCRWETTPVCDGTNSIEITVVRDAHWRTTWKLIIDRAASPFQFVFPSDTMGRTFWTSSAPFNLSVRAFGGTEVDYKVIFTCVNSQQCDTSKRENPVAWSSGVLLSDVDGGGPFPYNQSDGTCNFTIVCGGGFTHIEFPAIRGTLPGGHTLHVEDQMFSGTLDAATTLPTVGPSAFVRFVAPSSFAGGFALSYQCVSAYHRFVTTNFTLDCEDAGLSDIPHSSGEDALAALQADAHAAVASCAIPEGVSLDAIPFHIADDSVSFSFHVSGEREEATSVVECLNVALQSDPTLHHTLSFLLTTLNRSCLLSDVIGAGVTNSSPCGARPCTAAPFPSSSSASPTPSEEDSSSDRSALIGIIVGSVVGALLLLLLILLLVRRRRLGAHGLENPFFSSPGRYTKGFNLKADAELVELSTKRIGNDLEGFEIDDILGELQKPAVVIGDDI